MKNIGFRGAFSLCTLGPSSDVTVFFKVVKNIASEYFPTEDFSLLTDRLFKRYLRLDELTKASLLMQKIQATMSTTPTSSLNWEKLGLITANSRLDISQSNLAEVFARYFQAFTTCVESVQICSDEKDDQFNSVKTAVSDLPFSMDDKDRPLDEYDALSSDAPPFWLRFQM